MAEGRLNWLLPRLTLLAAAVSCIALGAPTWFATPLALAVVVTVIAPLASRRSDGVEAWAVGLGALLVTLVLLGLLLNLLPSGLDRTTWTLALGVCGAGALTATAYLGGPPPAHRRQLPPLLTRFRAYLWYAAAVPVLIVALLISVHATHKAEAPPLALAARYVNANAARIVVASTAASGPLRLELESNGHSQTLNDTFQVSADRPVTRTFAVTSRSRLTVTLTDASSGVTLRSIVLEPS